MNAPEKYLSVDGYRFGVTPRNGYKEKTLNGYREYGSDDKARRLYYLRVSCELEEMLELRDFYNTPGQCRRAIEKLKDQFDAEITPRGTICS